VHTGAMNTTLPPPPSKPVRLTIPVSREVHNVFQRLARAGSMSTGRAMGDWLGDTVEAAEFMASTMERARAAPKIVTAELHAMALGMSEQTKELMDKFGQLGKAARASGRTPATPAHSEARTAGGGVRPDGLAGARLSIPPSCNTGGKVPQVNPKPKGGKSS